MVKTKSGLVYVMRKSYGSWKTTGESFQAIGCGSWSDSSPAGCGRQTEKRTALWKIFHIRSLKNGR